jgi:hypothetical protein
MNQDVREAFRAAFESDDIYGVISAIGPTVTLSWRADAVRLVDDVEDAHGRVARLLEEPTTMTEPLTREFTPEGANSPSATASPTQGDRGTDQSSSG